ncbi:hypothetical protein BCN_1641 [Bacillus cereus NC7401]|nr:hypothetical protein BCN_1641 [Bacillus cereus NC7401]
MVAVVGANKWLVCCKNREILIGSKANCWVVLLRPLTIVSI